MQRDNVTASFYFNLSGVTSSNQISKSTSFVTFSIHIVTFSGEIGINGIARKEEVKYILPSNKNPPVTGLGGQFIKLFQVMRLQYFCW